MKFAKPICLFFLWVLITSTPAWAVTSQFTAVEDTFISESFPNTNYGSDITLLADGDDGTGGELATLIKWDLSSIPAGATVTAASITLNIFDISPGAYNIIRQNTPWSEGTADWSNLSGSAVVRGVIPAFASGQATINLNAAGVALVQGWLNGVFDNNGVTIRTAGTTNGIDMDSRDSSGFAPVLEVTYTGGGPTLESLQAEINALKALLAGVNRNGSTINFDGVNVQIRNGLGATNGNPGDPESLTDTTVNGLGNLVIGYNESHRNCSGLHCVLFKSGSHNVVIGHGHAYNSFGGFVAGQDNKSDAPYSTVSGGLFNDALGDHASVVGGTGNDAIGAKSTVLGGATNNAEAIQSSVSGGINNIADGINASVLGGQGNMASNTSATVSGGVNNNADGVWSSVSGGRNNTASGTGSTVSGGEDRTAADEYDWVAGALFQDD